MSVERMIPTEPGIYYDIPFRDYCAIDAVNNSSLGEALISSLAYSHRQPLEDRKVLRLGRLTHCGKFEPLMVAQRYAVMPDYQFDAENLTAKGELPKSPKSTGYYNAKKAEFETANREKEIITAVEYENVHLQVKALKANERAAEYLENAEYEVTMLWIDEETGLLCKSRTDALQPKRITDLKTTGVIDDFSRSIALYAYDRQGAFYLDGARANGLEIDEFCIVAIQSCRPWDVAAAPVDEDTIADGRITYKKALRTIAEYRQTGIAKGIGNPEVWRKPDWAFKKNQEESDDEAVDRLTRELSESEATE